MCLNFLPLFFFSADNDAGSDILPTIIVPPVDTTTITGEVSTALECVANARLASSRY